MALALRLPGLTWGLPNAEHWYSYHPDEKQIRDAVLRLYLGKDWNPHFFNYPSLFIYFTYFAFWCQGVLGLGTPMAGRAPWPVYHDIILCGRIVCALLGAFTIPAVYGIGKRIGGAKVACFAAFLMAVVPGHVQHSHFATVDVAATFFVAWSLFFAVRALLPPPSLPRRGRSHALDQVTPPPPGEAGWGQSAKALLISAFLAGLAAATKYNAGLVLIAPLCALWFGGFDKKLIRMLGAIILAIVAFVIGCPFSVLNTTEFLGNRTDSGLIYELLVHPKQGQADIFTNTGNGWLYHLTFNLPFVLTAPLTIAAVAGLFVAARSKNKLWMPILAFAGLYFFTLGLSQVRYMRYNLPLVPVLCLAAAFALASLPRPAKNLVASALALLVFIGATNVLYPFCVTDPRDQAAAYLKSTITKPVTIALINRPWFYTPPLWPQDYPPPSNVIKGASPDGRFSFIAFQFDPEISKKNDIVIINEFEWRDAERLKNGFQSELLSGMADSDIRTKNAKQFWKRAYLSKFGTEMEPGFWRMPRQFRVEVPLALPGRNFVPHDFLYTNPGTIIYQRNR